MVIECNFCRARYWMKESMMKGGKGAKVRCRKCGGTFVVAAPGTVPGVAGSGDRRFRFGTSPKSRSLKEAEGAAREKEDSPPGGAGERLRPAQAPTQRFPQPAEKIAPDPPVPDNVYSLNRFRETRPRRFHTGAYDISGTIRPWPSVSPAEQRSAETSSLPVPREEEKRIQSILLEEPVQWKVRGTAGPPDPDPYVPPREAKILELSPSDGSQFQAGHTASANTLITNIAIVYLVLLVLGGCGYLIVHFLSRMMG